MFVYYGGLTFNACLVIPLALINGPGKVENMLISAKLMKPIAWLLGKESLLNYMITSN